MTTRKIKARLEKLRAALRAERISYDELHELQTLAPHIVPGDVELLEAAGVPEHHKAQTFRVWRRSVNRNSFGYREYWLTDKDGVTFTACRVYDLPVDSEVTIYNDEWMAQGFEIPTRFKPDAPAKVVKEIFARPLVASDLNACVMGR